MVKCTAFDLTGNIDVKDKEGKPLRDDCEKVKMAVLNDKMLCGGKNSYLIYEVRGKIKKVRESV
jgi:hypothetical protein